MRSLLEGLIAGLAALGVGLIGKYRGWGPLQAAAAAAATGKKWLWCPTAALP